MQLIFFRLVGGGTAGSVVASRLSEVSCVNVLLLEAGNEPPLLYEVPGLARYIQGKDPTDWKFKTAPQKKTGKGIKKQVRRNYSWSLKIFYIMQFRNNKQNIFLFSNFLFVCLFK